ncbi:methionine ABC transporter ATP-binding protein [Micrococcus flavus]|uniref:D-methionine transport system ATP-binding protein n=1 Tax=Micrococcus flavus TaxID=384602 RepID=A0A4Y8WWF2_9MICC|nr:methionine ABC transporter ATP-binding protein [Micrococcus flavus]MBB4883594.1 D-methionine transport system ATP-binding protein [Micrococcus flavus]TFH99532.1 methionine ABC transporter ATP-binding protein [Micrococcus flavus]GGK54578.1 methionine import ATP-binding protein MetN [Micrococcus flavus]
MLEIVDLHKRYELKTGRPVEVLKGIDLTVPDGSITAVVGPSGAGKSTLSRCISLLEMPSSGQILVDGRNLSELSGRALRDSRRSIGTIFQHSALLRRITVAENVALPLRNLGVEHGEMEARVAELLERVDLLHKADAYPGQLSGGQAQRVGIARALALRPRILLSDESTSGLDPRSTHQILRLLTELRADLGVSIVLITHEMEAVRAAADEVAFLDHGRIAEHGRVADLIGRGDSPAAGQLLPVHPVERVPGVRTVLRVSLGSVPVDPAWFGDLARAVSAGVSLLGGTLEDHGTRPLGRLVIGLDTDDQRQVAAAVAVLDAAGLRVIVEGGADVPVRGRPADADLTREVAGVAA